MTKVAILGSTGMLGTAVLNAFQKEDLEVISTTRKELDAQKANLSDIENIIKDCDWIINCIGIIKPYIHDDNSFEVMRAIEVNALFPHKLAKASLNTNAKIIQIATDCVYDGKDGFYNEQSLHNAIDVYGKTKSLGEVKQENFINLRCSIIGKEEKAYLSLLEWFLRQPKDAKVNGYLNHIWNGVTTDVFAQLCLGIIKNNYVFSGVQHIIPQDIVSKAQMLVMFKNKFNRQDISINNIDAKDSINRTLATINLNRNKEIWGNSIYKSILSIEEMINNL